LNDEAPYHAHIYYSDEDRPVAERLRGEFQAHSDILFVGRMMDRVGPRAVMELGVLLMAAGLLLAPLTGPEVAPPEVFTAENVERILSLT